MKTTKYWSRKYSESMQDDSQNKFGETMDPKTILKTSSIYINNQRTTLEVEEE